MKKNIVFQKKRRTKGRKLKHRVKKYYDDVDDAYYTENDDNDYEDYENSEENENDSETVKAKQKKKEKKKGISKSIKL